MKNIEDMYVERREQNKNMYNYDNYSHNDFIEHAEYASLKRIKLNKEFILEQLERDKDKNNALFYLPLILTGLSVYLILTEQPFEPVHVIVRNIPMIILTFVAWMMFHLKKSEIDTMINNFLSDKFYVTKVIAIDLKKNYSHWIKFRRMRYEATLDLGHLKKRVPARIFHMLEMDKEAFLIVFNEKNKKESFVFPMSDYELDDELKNKFQVE